MLKRLELIVVDLAAAAAAPEAPVRGILVRVVRLEGRATFLAFLAGALLELAAGALRFLPPETSTSIESVTGRSSAEETAEGLRRVRRRALDEGRT